MRMRNAQCEISDPQCRCEYLQNEHTAHSCLPMQTCCPSQGIFWTYAHCLSQTCEITWNTPAEVSSHLPANDAWNGPLGTSLFFNTISMHCHLQNACVLYLNRLRDCYMCTLGSSVLSTMQLQRMAWKQQPKWRSDHVLASDGNQLCYFKYCGAFGGDGAGHNMFFVFFDSSMAAHRVQWWSVLWKLHHADLKFGTAQGYSSPVSWS